MVDNQDKRPKPFSKRGLVSIWLIAALTLLAFSTYWMIVARKIEQKINAATLNVPGLVIGRTEVVGFPYRFSVRLHNVSLERADGLVFTSSNLAWTAASVNPFLWALDRADQVIFALPGGHPRAVTISDLKGSLRVSTKGLERLSVTQKGAVASPYKADDTPWRLDGAAFHLIRDDKIAGRYGVSIELTNITLPNAPRGPAAILGNQIHHISLRGPINQGGQMANGLRTWASSGGQFDVMAGDLVWGPFSIQSPHGTLTLDNDGHWQGKISATGGISQDREESGPPLLDLDLEIAAGRLKFMGMDIAAIPDGF